MTTKLLCLATCYMPVGKIEITVGTGRSKKKVQKEIVDRFEDDDDVYEVSDGRVSAYLASGNFARLEEE